jgi:hypothetical protein
MSREDFTIVGTIVLIGLLIILLFGWMKQREIEAYNHVTGKNISFSDGIWLELRVSEAPTKEGK